MLLRATITVKGGKLRATPAIPLQADATTVKSAKSNSSDRKAIRTLKVTQQKRPLLGVLRATLHIRGIAGGDSLQSGVHIPKGK